MLTVACGTPPSTPTPTASVMTADPFVVQGLTNEDLLYTTTIVDETGVLEDADVVPADSTGIDLTNPDMEAIALDPDDDHAILVAWAGFPCEDRPSLLIEEADSALVVELDRGPQREGEACPFYPHYFALRLQFNRSLTTDSVRLQLAE